MSIHRKVFLLSSATDVRFVPERKSVFGRSSDFWTLGGASIAFWLLLQLMGFFDQNISVARFSANLPVIFAALAIVCNWPHFMASYQFGYGRGSRFIFRQWGSLILVPAILLAVFAFAALQFNEDPWEIPWISASQTVMESTFVNLELRQLNHVGALILNLGVWTMYLTSGWHYGKQAFGCMLVYARYDGYVLLPWQRRLLKYNLFAIAFLNFTFLVGVLPKQGNFLTLPLADLSLPAWLRSLSEVSFWLTWIAVVGVMVERGIRQKIWPSPQFLMPWLALILWWHPWFWSERFYFLFAPFFHALQYLPFAHAMMAGTQSTQRTLFPRIGFHLQFVALVVVGFLVFDVAPSALDIHFQSMVEYQCAFFLIAVVLFLNIHHFFIDAVVWRSSQPEFRKALFEG